MSLLGNIIWLLLGGIFACLTYLIAGLSLCLTIIGIPFGIQSFKLGIAILAPFGMEIVPLPDADSPLRIIFNIIWLILFGWEIAVGHVFWGVVLCITILGIPFGMQHFKLVPLALWPFGRTLQRTA